MSRKRLTQLFPFLLPLRLWQRKKCFYLKMKLDKTRRSDNIFPDVLPYRLYEYSCGTINRKSGFDIRYQYNKVHNLKLAAGKINHILIKPGETFSFWWAARDADKKIPYKDGLDLTDGKIRGAYGGGLCQLSNLLFWLFLHTPLEITERHPHTIEAFPSASDELPSGTDATIHEGWLDLQAYNGTDSTFQILIEFDDERDSIMGCILSDSEPVYEYDIFNNEKHYRKKEGKTFLDCTVDCVKTNRKSGEKKIYNLYRNLCEITYPLPDNIKFS
ncbi:MAG: glycopeptide resistance accessory protein VanW [Ruminococcaceae bacterium]|nr:glycopeptide resistance accessory protein VanW [Oscillospiraceae bacterium]